MALKMFEVKFEYEKNKNLKKEDVTALIDWTNRQPHLPTINEAQIVLFLQSCHFRNEAAKIVIDTYFTLKTLWSDIYEPRNPEAASVKNVLDVSLMTPLPQKTPEGHTIFFVKIVDLAPEKFIYLDQVRTFDMMAMAHLYREGTSEGHLIVLDMADLSFGHMTRISPIILRKFLFYLQEAMPFRLKGLHFFNVKPFMDKIFNLVKSLLKKELVEMLFLHNTLEDLIKIVPQHCLPKNYGGTAEEITILREQMREFFRTSVPIFEWESSQKVDENRRVGKLKKVDDYFGVEGTFKKLEID